MKFSAFLTTLTKTTAETGQALQGPVFWLITLAASAICIMSGPFGTFDALPTGLRLVYWAVVVLATASLGQWASALVRVTGWDKGLPVVCVAFVFGLCTFGIVTAVSLALLEPIQRYPGTFDIFVYSCPSAAMIFLMTVYLGRAWEERSPQIPTPDTATDRPALLRRLSKHVHARQILALSAQDHYVEIITELGSELCLIRLKDAIAEAAPIKGVQIHRSHWVNLSAVERLETNATTAELHLHNGHRLKISQSRLRDVKQTLAQHQQPA